MAVTGTAISQSDNGDHPARAAAPPRRNKLTARNPIGKNRFKRSASLSLHNAARGSSTASRPRI